MWNWPFANAGPTYAIFFGAQFGVVPSRHSGFDPTFFVNEVRAQGGKKIGLALAAQLIAGAQAILPLPSRSKSGLSVLAVEGNHW